MNDWKCEIKNWIDIRLETAKFFFNQAEKMLESTNNVNQQLMSKSHKIIVLLMPLISAAIGYLISLIRNDGFYSAESAAIIFFVVCLSISLKYALTIWSPKTEHFLGSSPKKIMHPIFIKSGESKSENDLQTIQILFSECHSYQRRIDSNIDHNLNFTNKLTISIKWLIVSPFVALLCYITITFLSHVHPCRFF